MSVYQRVSISISYYDFVDSCRSQYFGHFLHPWPMAKRHHRGTFRCQLPQLPARALRVQPAPQGFLAFDVTAGHVTVASCHGAAVVQHGTSLAVWWLRPMKYSIIVGDLMIINK